MPRYLKDKITKTKHTDRPNWGISADGYTHRSGAPTSIMVLLEGEKRWRRLMFWQFSNAGTFFIRKGGESLIVSNVPSEK